MVTVMSADALGMDTPIGHAELPLDFIWQGQVLLALPRSG